MCSTFVALTCFELQEVDDADAYARSKALLYVLSVLPAQGIPAELFEGGASSGLPFAELFTGAGLTDALVPLLEENLVRQQPDGSLVVHKIVQRSSRALLQGGVEARVLETLGVLFNERLVDCSDTSRRFNRQFIQ